MVSIETDMSNFHPLKLVGRGSQTKFLVREKIEIDLAILGLMVQVRFWTHCIWNRSGNKLI